MERLKKIGALVPKASKDIQKSKIGIGFEKLDRNVFDPEKAYDKVAAIGVKWVRIQSGWARTEKEKGVYSFEWIDSIVDNLLRRGMQPWICLCYGNGLYDESAAKVFGAVGCPPIHTEEQKTAWANYCRAIAARYRGRVDHFEVWNEPDSKWCWKHGASADELGRFTVDTAKAVREGNPDVYLIGGVVCTRPLAYPNTALAVGMGEVIDAISFHEYTPRETEVLERVRALRALGRRYNPNMEIIQGESGSQSRAGGHGALREGGWTQEKQAKQLLRHTVIDLIADVKFTSYFSCMDMIEALRGTVGQTDSYLDYGYFGVLGAEFDENGFSTGDYQPKKSYYALQNLCSVFTEEVKAVDLPVLVLPEPSGWVFGNDLSLSQLTLSGFRKADGSTAVAYWSPTDLMTTSFEGTVTFQVVAEPGAEIRLADPMDGSVYQIPPEMIEDEGNGCLRFRHIPVRDYPLFLCFNGFEK